MIYPYSTYLSAVYQSMKNSVVDNIGISIIHNKNEISKLLYINKSRIQPLKVRTHEKTWKKSKWILLLSERNQPEKATYYRIPTTWHSGKGTTRYSKRISDHQGLGQRETNTAQKIFRAVKLLCMTL